MNKQSNLMLVHDIKPIVQGFSLQIIETGQHLQINMDDLFEWMTIHTDKAHTEGQFNHELDIMDELELSYVLGDMYSHSPEKFEATQPFPIPDKDHYGQFRSLEEIIEHIGQRPSSTELEIMKKGMLTKEMHDLNKAATEIHQMKIHAGNLAEQINILIQKAREVITTTSLMHWGQPTIGNLLNGFKVVRKCIRKDGTKGRPQNCSETWLHEKITETEIQELMIGEIIEIKAKSGKGQSRYQLKRINIHG